MKEKHEALNDFCQKVDPPRTLLAKVQEEINDITNARLAKLEELSQLDKSLAMLYQVRQALTREII